jgi:hypothetical protein
MTNGDDSVFVKLSQAEGKQYNVSRVFAALTSVQELQKILQGLKQLSNLVKN